MQCLIKDSEYWTKLAQSGIPEPVFYHFANSFVAKYGRFPNLDEIPGANSSKYLKDQIHLKDSAKISDVLAVTQTSNIKDANIVLNDTYSDLEVVLTPLKEEALVDVEQRPSEYLSNQIEKRPVNNNVPGTTVFHRMFEKLRNLYGINLIQITSKELAQIEGIPEIQSASAFVYNGDIYINTDFADIDAPIHELTHILLGSIRFKNPELYTQLVEEAYKFPSFKLMTEQYPNKTRLDVLEEIFVSETAKYLSGMSSQLNLLDEAVLYEIHYNIKRLLDSVLMGQYSVKSIEDSQLYNMSFKQLADIVNSELIHGDNLGSLDDASLHRMLSNKKSELMKNGDLREDCE